MSVDSVNTGSHEKLFAKHPDFLCSSHSKEEETMIFTPASNGPGQSRIPGADSKSSNTFQGGKGLVHVHCLWTSLIPRRDERDSLSERLGMVGQGGTCVNGVTGDPLTPMLGGESGGRRRAGEEITSVCPWGG